MRVHDILLLLSALAGCLVANAVSDPRARLLPTNHGKRRGGAYFQRNNAAVDQGLTRALRSRGGEIVRPATAAASAIAYLDSEKRTETRGRPNQEANEQRGAKGWGQLRRSQGSQSSELVPRGACLMVWGLRVGEGFCMLPTSTQPPAYAVVAGCVLRGFPRALGDGTHGALSGKGVGRRGIRERRRRA